MPESKIRRYPISWVTYRREKGSIHWVEVNRVASRQIHNSNLLLCNHNYNLRLCSSQVAWRFGSSISLPPLLGRNYRRERTDAFASREKGANARRGRKEWVMVVLVGMGLKVGLFNEVDFQQCCSQPGLRIIATTSTSAPKSPLES